MNKGKVARGPDGPTTTKKTNRQDTGPIKLCARGHMFHPAAYDDPSTARLISQHLRWEIKKEKKGKKRKKKEKNGWKRVNWN